MKIKHCDGNVTYTMRAGKDLVRSTIPLSSACAIVKNGKNVVEKDDQIIVDDHYFFPAEAEKTAPKRKKKTEDAAE